MFRLPPPRCPAQTDKSRSMWWAVLLLVFVLPEIVAFTRPATRTVAPSGAGRVDRAVVSMYCGVCGGKIVDTSAHRNAGSLLDADAHKAGTQVVADGQPKKGSKKRREGCCTCCPAGCTCCLAGCQCPL